MAILRLAKMDQQNLELPRASGRRGEVTFFAGTTAIAATITLAIVQLELRYAGMLMPPLMLAIVHHFVTFKRHGQVSADRLFILSHLFMLVGTVLLVDQQRADDQEYVAVLAAATSIYTISSIVTAVCLPTAKNLSTDVEHAVTGPTRGMLYFLIISIVVVTVYFTQVGYSAFLKGLSGQLAGTETDMATLRLESYAGARYLFPGYVNQFKNIFLPSLTLILLTWAYTKRAFVPKLGSWLLAAFSILALLWTGQRGAFVSFLLVAIVYAYLYHGRRLSGPFLLAPLVGMPFFFLATKVLGRNDSAAAGIIERFTHDNQLSGLAAFRYTYQLPTQYGLEWLQGILGILPGNRGSTLSSEVFATLYGSTRGTAPASLWGSVHYNFGIPGLVIFAAGLGFAFQHVSSRFANLQKSNTIQLVGISGLTVVLGTWIAGGPDTLLNTGLVAYAFLWWWGKRLQNPAPMQHSRNRNS